MSRGGFGWMWGGCSRCWCLCTSVPLTREVQQEVEEFGRRVKGRHKLVFKKLGFGFLIISYNYKLNFIFYAAT